MRTCRTCARRKAFSMFRAARPDCFECEAKKARHRYTASIGPRAGIGGRKRKYK